MDETGSVILTNWGTLITGMVSSVVSVGLPGSDAYVSCYLSTDVEIPAGHIAHPSLAQVAARSHLVFSPNYPRLRDLKKKYDPDSVFNRWYPIAPAT